MKSTLWDQPERYVVVQAHNNLYPRIPDSIKCKHKWLHERIVLIRKEYDLFKSASFDETMKTHLISNMLTKWRAVMVDCSEATKCTKPYKYFSFPVRYRIVSWHDQGLTLEDVKGRGFFMDTLEPKIYKTNYLKSVLSAKEIEDLRSIFLPRKTCLKLEELYNGDTAEGPLYFYCEVASLYKQMVRAGRLRDTVMMWKFEQAVVSIITSTPKKRARLDVNSDVIMPAPQRVKIIN